MIKPCPYCQSDWIITKDEARRTFGLLGMIGGVASRLSGGYVGAELGMSLGLLLGPGGSAVGSITGALLGAAAGGIAGAKLGEVIDERVLDNYHCQQCGQDFGL